MYEVVEYKNSIRIVVGTGFTTLAAAQQHIANMDPAGRKTLAAEKVTR